VTKKFQRCIFPKCYRGVIPNNSPHGLCPRHEEELEFLLWAIPKIKLTEERKVPGLWVPGDPLPQGGKDG